MNFYTVASKIMKSADKAKNEQRLLIEKIYQQLGEIPNDVDSPEDAYDKKFNSEMQKFNDTCDLGIDLMTMFKSKLSTIENTNGERWYFITVRPPHDTIWETFKSDCESFVHKWKYKWLECTYVFEQKGETEENIGFGFHWHMRIATDTVNYYPSHIKRDLIKIFNYVNKACIKVEPIKCLERTIEYMKGDKKSKDKELACAMDILWRAKQGIPAEVKVVARQAIEV